jgi:hypothetical protein
VGGGRENTNGNFSPLETKNLMNAEIISYRPFIKWAQKEKL